MKQIFSVALLLLISSTLSAQIKLTGTVNDNQKLPLPYSGLTLSNLTNHQTVTSDSAGFFRFNNLKPGKYQLSASYTGFQKNSIDLILSADTSIKFVLQSLNNQLSEVIVTAGKPTLINNNEKLTYNVSNSITATGTDGLTAVSQIPGVKVSSNEITSAGKGQLKVMVNGQIIQLAGLDLMRYLKSISANQISKIEFIKNPSANFDADGNAGLLNIVTKQSKKQGYSGNVQLNGKHWIHDQRTIYGTSNFYALNGSASLNYNSEKLAIYSSINLDKDHHLEGFQTDLYYPKQTWLQTDTGDYTYRNINIIAGADYKLSPKTTIGLSYLGGRNVYDGSDHVNNPIYNQTGKLDSTLKTYATYHPIALSNSINMHTMINFDTTGKKLSLNADYYNYYRTDRSDFESNSYLPGLANAVNNTRYYDTNKQDINIYTFKADAELPTRYGALSFGGKLSFINNYSNAFYYNKINEHDQVYNINLSNEFDYTENTQSLYGNLSKILGKWRYQAGLRAELTQTKGYSYTVDQTTKNSYVKLFPSLLISYQADQDDSFSFTMGRRINRPSFWSLNPFKSLYTAYSYGQGNPYLQPEFNNNFELSHTYKNNLTSALFLNITENGFNNVTIVKPDTNLVYTTPINFLKTYRYGISESYSLKLFSWLENNNQATFYHTNAYSSNSSFNDIKGYGMYLASNNTVYFNADKTFAAAANFWYQFPEIDHIGRSGTTYKLDLGLTVLALKKNLNITFNVNDVFRSSATSVTTYVNGIKQKFTNFQINRFAQLSMSYRFGSKPSKARVTGNEDERGRNH
ncbi:TonB-dependent receptor [Pedobacter sp. PAMC26386]|nr:TonB-dependent receptor [Pedobacter sp. PAMC26386]